MELWARVFKISGGNRRKNMGLYLCRALVGEAKVFKIGAHKISGGKRQKNMDQAIARNISGIPYFTGPRPGRQFLF